MNILFLKIINLYIREIRNHFSKLHKLVVKFKNQNMTIIVKFYFV
jgi:hypothetical protein